MGINVLRIFPLWSDFQPLKPLLTWGGQIKEVRGKDDDILPEENAPSYLDEKCLDAFAQICDLADKYGFKLIVSLLSGYMSGRNFFPDTFLGRNVITDPLCIKWEVKYVQAFVERFKNRNEIIAWELGNECNWVCAHKRVSLNLLKKKNPNIHFTAHPLGANRYLIVAINNTTEDIAENFALNGYDIEIVYYGQVKKDGAAILKKCDAVVFEIKEKN